MAAQNQTLPLAHSSFVDAIAIMVMYIISIEERLVDEKCGCWGEN